MREAPQNGFADGLASHDTAQPGEFQSRLGSPSGGFTAPRGTPYEARGLPPRNLTSEYHEYVVREPYGVTRGPAREAFSMEGGGIQDLIDGKQSVGDLVESGHLEELHPVENYEVPRTGVSGAQGAISDEPNESNSE